MKNLKPPKTLCRAWAYKGDLTFNNYSLTVCFSKMAAEATWGKDSIVEVEIRQFHPRKEKGRGK